MVKLTAKQKLIILNIAFAGNLIPVMAQDIPADSTLLRTVIVEQEYNPAINDASKVTILPKAEDPALPKSRVEYDKNSFPLLFPGAGEAITPYTVANAASRTAPGYLRLGYGTRGNVDILGNYLFDLSRKDQLNLSFLMEGINTRLDIPEYITGLSQYKWQSRYYKTEGGVDFIHRFDQYTLDLSGKIGVDNFNFINILRPAYQEETDKQHHNYGDLHIGLKSADKTLPLQFIAGTNFLYFNKKYTFTDKSNREMILRTNADVFGMIDDYKKVGIEFGMNNLFYNHPDMENYSTIDFNPYFSMENEEYRIRLGLHVDYATGSGKTLQIAPDIHLQYNVAGTYALYLNATGGRVVNDFRRLQQVSPYLHPLTQAEDSYTQLDAIFGFKGSPADELWFNIFGGYKITHKDLLLNPSFTFITTPFYNLAENHRDSNHFLLGGEVKYKFKNYIDLNLRGSYYGWDFNNEVDAIYYLMKPNAEIAFNISSNPIERLTLELGFTYIQWHSRTGTSIDYTPDGKEIESETTQQMDAVANLQLGATYKIFKGLGVYTRVDNLLNKKYQYNYGYPTPGFSILGGVIYQF